MHNAVENISQSTHCFFSSNWQRDNNNSFETAQQLENRTYIVSNKFFFPQEEDSMPPARTIRAPQLRLRFGRSDPLWSSSADRAAAAAAFLEDKRAPSQRLRWGRSQPGTFNENALREAVLARGDDLNRDPTLRLRWGRESGEDDEFDSDSDNVADRLYREATGMDRFAEDKRAPSQRLRWGRSDPLVSW